MNAVSDSLLTGVTPLARILHVASTLPAPPALLVDLLRGRLSLPAGVLAGLELDANLRGAVMASVRLRHGALPDLGHAWVRLGTATMVGHLVDAALVLHLDRLPAAPEHFGQAFAVAGALRALGRPEGIEPGLATATGALHGVGTIALVQALRIISPNVSARLALGEVGLPVVEQALRTDRFQVGASLLAMQGMPLELWQAIGRQAAPDGHPLARLLHTARRVLDPVQPLKGHAAAAASDAVQHAERLRRVLCGR